MRITLSIVLAATLGLACATSRPAEHARSPDRVGDGRGPPSLATNAGQVEGLVAEVDREAGTVSVQAGDTVRTVPLAVEATVLIDDFDATFEDVQEGQAVRAALQETDGRVEAVRLQILNHAVPVERPDAGAEPAAEVTPPAGTGAEEPADAP